MTKQLRRFIAMFDKNGMIEERIFYAHSIQSAFNAARLTADNPDVQEDYGLTLRGVVEEAPCDKVISATRA